MSAPQSAPLRVLALTRTSRRGPSTRYRIEQYRAELAARGIELDSRPLFGDTWFTILELRPAPLRALLKAGYSLARLAPAWSRPAARARAARTTSCSSSSSSSPTCPGGSRSACGPLARRCCWNSTTRSGSARDTRRSSPPSARAPRWVLVGNDFLREWAAQHARRTGRIPTTIDVQRYPFAPPRIRRRRPLRVGLDRAALQPRLPLAALGPAAAAAGLGAARGAARDQQRRSERARVEPG
jgi:hypothetical protein